MDYASNGHPSGRKIAGLAVVAGLHAVLVYGLVNGLARGILPGIQPVTDVTVVPPASEPPPRVEPLRQPDFVKPTMPHIPLPEIPVTAPMDTPMTAVSRDVPTASTLGPSLPVPPEQGKHAAAAPSHVPAVVDFSSCAKPAYPSQSARMGNEGMVVLQFLIGTDGRVVESRIERSSGFRDLDRSAQQALVQCRFTPALVDGRPQQSWTSVQYVWRLE